MINNYLHELEFITEKIRQAYEKFAFSGKRDVFQKSHFDLVTDLDMNIEKYLSDAITKEFSGDLIHGEETAPKQALNGRTWVIDPIDGTCNMARDIMLHGVQCALFDKGNDVLGVIYLPYTDQMMYAVKGCGAYLNGERITVNSTVCINNVIASIGDYSHNDDDIAARQHSSMGYLYPRIAKIRMFGAACFDFGYVAQGKTDATVVITKNLWDIAPGVIICKEAGAIVTNLEGEPYCYGDDGAVACANEEISRLIKTSFDKRVTLKDKNGQEHKFKCCIFDFDGVVVDTEKYHLIAWNESGRPHGVVIGDEEYLPLKSTGREYIVNYIANKSGKCLTDEEKKIIGDTKDRVYTEITADLSDKDKISGVEDYLTYLNGIGVKCAIASSSLFAGKISKELSLDGYFNVICDANIPMPRKPAPDMFLLTVRLCGCTPDETVVFEDSIAGINAAVNAGMKVVAIGGIKHDGAMLCVKDFTELSFE